MIRQSVRHIAEYKYTQKGHISDSHMYFQNIESVTFHYEENNIHAMNIWIIKRLHVM